MPSHQVSPEQIEAVVSDLRRQLDAAERGTLARLECSPESIEQGLARLVLGLIELLRRLLERQAVRRMEGGSLNEQQKKVAHLPFGDDRRFVWDYRPLESTPRPGLRVINMNDDQKQNTTHLRTVDLSSLAGKTVNAVARWF